MALLLFKVVDITHTSPVTICLMVCVDAVARVREYVLANQDVYRDTTRYILGGGWDHTFWPLGGWPSAVRLIFCPRDIRQMFSSVGGSGSGSYSQRKAHCPSK